MDGLSKEIVQGFIKNETPLDFGVAILLLKKGYKVKRKGWGGYWFIETVEHWGEFKFEPYEPPLCSTEMIMAKLKDGAGYAPAMPYQADMLANDWIVLK